MKRKGGRKREKEKGQGREGNLGEESWSKANQIKENESKTKERKANELERRTDENIGRKRSRMNNDLGFETP